MFASIEELDTAVSGVAAQKNGKTVLTDEKRLKETLVDQLITTAVFAADATLRENAKEQIAALATALGAKPSSIHALYRAFGSGEVQGFTVPAFNIRTLTYDTARTVFRLAKEINAGAFIFEIARSEMGYTMQRPDEYAACILAAAIKEGYCLPVFIQGDHFQVKKTAFDENPEKELQNLKDLIAESLAAGFYNIDIDASTIVDLTRGNLSEQQRKNYETTAALTKFIRSHQPENVTISIGGEIGHIGGRNSTVADFEAFMEGYLPLLAGVEGIRKVSVQTGTSHGGIPMPDGSMAEIKLDFSVLRDIGNVAREKYKLGGAVQHGASTLPNELFSQFTASKTLEVHLATGFQNIVFATMPEELRKEMEAWTADNVASERDETMTDQQFVYKFRKKALGPFKRQLWDLSDEDKQPILQKLEEQFRFLFGAFNLQDSKGAVLKYSKQ